MSQAAKAVFLSYATEDSVAAQRICAALRAAGVEVWFDQSELRGGDAWDAAIRQQIKACALFVPVISRATQTRDEGYFRLEWKLAVDRSHLIAADRAFLLPVVIDDTSNAVARVPERFFEVQWSRLPDGETPPAFVERVTRLLRPDPTAVPTTPRTAVVAQALRFQRANVPMIARVAAGAAVALVLGAYAVGRLAPKDHTALSADAPATSRSASTTPFSPPPRSIAVLPFANLSGDPGQDYFSDGMSEELLNSLSQISDLHVAARTSAFSFRGTRTDIATIARKLNVSAVLEGSVRRSDHTIRITVQLVDSVTGFHLWSKTYDRNSGDVLKLQTEIAAAVAGALKVTLLGDVATRGELGGTQDTAAYDAYLRGRKSSVSIRDKNDFPRAIDAYTQAIRLDPDYALAYAARSLALSSLAGNAETEAAVQEGFSKAQADARRALELAPNLGEAHLALATVFDYALDFIRANDEYQRARALSPGNSIVLRKSASFAAAMGRFDEAVASARRAVTLDPLASASHGTLGQALFRARRYQESVAAYDEAISLAPEFKASYPARGLAYYALGEFAQARRSCETASNDVIGEVCLAVVYEKLSRRDDAQAQLARLLASNGDTDAYQYAEIYAQWGDRAKALDWLERAWRLRDPGLLGVKTDPLLDPVRGEPRFKAIEVQLKFPS